MDRDIQQGLLMLGGTAICAILAIVLFVVTPFLPDEAVPALIGLVSGIFGVKKLVSARSD